LHHPQVERLSNLAADLIVVLTFVMIHALVSGLLTVVHVSAEYFTSSQGCSSMKLNDKHKYNVNARIDIF